MGFGLGSVCMESFEDYKARMERALANQQYHWVAPKEAISVLESLGYVTEKEGKKWAFGGWVHEDLRAGTKS